MMPHFHGMSQRPRGTRLGDAPSRGGAGRGGERAGPEPRPDRLLDRFGHHRGIPEANLALGGVNVDVDPSRIRVYEEKDVGPGMRGERRAVPA
jgi:hypothetical protein